MISVRTMLVCVMAILVMLPFQAQAQDQAQAASIEALKAQIEALKADYEKRIKNLEDQVQQLQVQMLQAAPEAPPTEVAQPAVQSIPGALNPAIAVASNFVSRTDNQNVYNADNDRIDNKLNLREAELDLRTSVDPYADGVLVATIESETPGVFSAGVEEGYVTIKKFPWLTTMPLGLKLKAGIFRPLFGQTNILHTHDLPTTFRSLVVQEFLGQEGFNSNGVSGNFFIPTPWSKNSSLDATLNVLTGGSIAAAPEQHAPVSYADHLRWFQALNDANNLTLGWSDHFQAGKGGVTDANIHAFDFLYRWKPIRMGEWKSFLLGGEMMFSPKAYANADESPDVARGIKEDSIQPGQGKPFGYSVFSQWQFNRRVYAGARWDQTDILYNPAYQHESITPYLTYYFSEFLRFRVDYEHRWSDLTSDNGRNSVYFELNWIFGAHPPEPFWVNK